MQNKTITIMMLAGLALGSQAYAQTKPAAGQQPAPAPSLKPCTSVTVDPATNVTLGKSSVVKLSTPVSRMVVGGIGSSRAGRPADGRNPQPGVPGAPPAGAAQQGGDSVADVDITLLSPTELFVLGKKSGSMNLVLQGNDGRCVVKDIIVTIDPGTLQAKLAELMPEEKDIRIKGAENAIVLTGKVSDALKLDDVVTLASAYGDGKKVVNMLRVTTPQQVMLEVKIAEVSKKLLDRFGLDYSRAYTSADGLTSRIISGIIGGGSAVFGQFSPNISGGAITGNAASAVSGTSAAAIANLSTTSRGATLFGIDAQKQDGLIRVLAEPNIMAISGQSASFLSGGKIFIPVAQSNSGGGTVMTLEEKEFGVGLKFTPTVLDGTRINLKLVSEASELSQTGSPFTTVNGVTSVLPSIATRRVDTTVQLNDGQSFAVAGLVKNNVTETINSFPGVGEVPVVGALFRSTEFQKDQTELLFVITPRLVKPVSADITLPTDNHIVPGRADAIFMGKSEGAPEALAPANK
ncbi:type II and III secretion system protein family protein [Noviherbaspirillum cavernae]|uniref:Type II and III secretion system protein family protein n=1 Tax=Noviherbaspirillum cavernae TaxID=2320862 RepID=A0A418WWJ1_9BURK|nr:type II and III secretion system protein family protein [Noviherbaspirillum cavernae]RJF96959.1 type II and III secretion system protein family protein [Noviherbaspirillum cavernae]